MPEPRSRRRARARDRLAPLAREHWLFLCVLALAALLRAAVELAYPPLLYPDSLAYLRLAWGEGGIVGLAPDRPSGYPFLIKLLPGHDSLGWITATQHLAGLATGTIAYVLLVKLGTRRWVAALAAALVLLDSYAVALEQRVMPEAFFGLALMGAMALAVLARKRPAMLAGSGLLLAAAATIRTAALFVVPVWAAYLLWAQRGRRALLAAVLALVVPLLAYATVYDTQTGKFGMTAAEGWFLYGRVAQIGACGNADIPRAARPLCDRPARVSMGGGAAFYLYSPDSPALRLFGQSGIGRDPHAPARANQILRDYSLAIIRDRPLRYARVVGADFARYFVPGAGSKSIADQALRFPGSSLLGASPVLRLQGGLPDTAAVRQVAPYFPAGYHPTVRAPAGALRAYQRVFHTPRWLMAVFVLAALAMLVLALAGRGRDALPRRREVLLLTGVPLLMLLGSAATAAFILRYLVPLVPLLACAGVMALEDLWALRDRAARGTGEAVPVTRRT